MAYSRVNWINEQEGSTTPLNAENLNTMDEGIANLDERVTELEKGGGGGGDVDERLTILEEDNYTNKRGISALNRDNTLNKAAIENLDERVEALEETPARITDAFSIVKVGNVELEANGADTFTLKAGTNVTMTANAETKEVTINSTGGGGGGGTSSWSELTDKPFETLGSDFSVVDEELQIKAPTTQTANVDSDGKTVTFTDIDPSKCYKPYADVGTSFTDRKPVGIETMTLNGNTLTYVLTNASAGMEIVLREIKL